MMENQPTSQFSSFTPESQNLAIAHLTRRNLNRLPWRSTLEIQPLDNDLNHTGKPFRAYSSNINRLGLGFVTAQAIENQYLRVSVVDEDISIFTQVVHVTNIGEDYPEYLVGVEYLS